MKISVITVAYNSAGTIGDTLRSVAIQTHPNIEHIVVDGASTDETVAVVRVQGRHVTTLLSEPDEGIYDAMNKAVSRASGEYLLLMNCGDVFAGPDALANAMALTSPGTQQVIFGGWVRAEADGRQRLCVPSLEAGLFNHQAIIYSRAIHRWHGDYVGVRGLTTADYLFFATLVASEAVECKTLAEPIAKIDVAGISAGLQTFSQKHAIDFLCGRSSRWKLASVFALHPAYFGIKRLWRRLR